MSKIKLKKHQDTYYIDIQDFTDLIDIHIVESYQLTVDNGCLIIEFFDKHGKSIVGKINKEL